MYQIRHYLTFLIQSTNHHGVHSPFVFDFVTKCLYDKKNYQAYSKIQDYRNTLLNHTDSLEITDYGSGSKVFKSTRRAIPKIAEYSGASLRISKLVFRITKYFEPKRTLELGTSLGIATHAMALGNPNTNIISIEGCPNCSSFAEKQILKFGIKNVTVRNETFQNIIPQLEGTNFDIIYFDGHHSKDATISYFELLLNNAHNESLFIFDDIYWSSGMTEAWNYIKAHKSVTVTIDCFHLGFVFFRKEQAKEHFKIRL